MAVVITGLRRFERTSQHDHLTARWALRLEQDRVHFDGGFDTGCFRLHRLCPAYLATTLGHERIQRHILRFEGSDPPAILCEHAAQARYQRALPHCRGRSLHHECLCLTHTISCKASSNCCHSLLGRVATRTNWGSPNEVQSRTSMFLARSC